MQVRSIQRRKSIKRSREYHHNRMVRKYGPLRAWLIRLGIASARV